MLETEIVRLRAEVKELKATKELCDNTEAYNIALEEIRELKHEVERLNLVDAAHEFTESVLERERDEAFKEVERLKSKYEPIARA